ncbi:MAG: hypothetical protein FWF57_05350 [Defluviitaleaceae bacterium]|nr:hypothetical protein [Defluviitaleaceae bacterium]
MTSKKRIFFSLLASLFITSTFVIFALLILNRIVYTIPFSEIELKLNSENVVRYNNVQNSYIIISSKEDVYKVFAYEIGILQNTYRLRWSTEISKNDNITSVIYGRKNLFLIIVDNLNINYYIQNPRFQNIVAIFFGFLGSNIAMFKIIYKSNKFWRKYKDN